MLDKLGAACLERIPLESREVTAQQHAQLLALRSGELVADAQRSDTLRDVGRRQRV